MKTTRGLFKLRLPSLFNQELSRLLLKGFTWNLIGNLVSKGAVFLMSVVASNVLGMENFGRIGVIQQTTAFLITFSVMGLAQTAIKFVGNARDSKCEQKKALISQLVIIGLSMSFVLAMAYYFSASVIADKMFNDDELTYYFKISSLILIGSTLNQIQFGILSGLGLFRELAISNILVGLVNLPLTFILMFKFGLAGFVWALVISCMITGLLNRLFILKNVTKSEGDFVSGNEYIPPTYGEIISYASSNVAGAILFTFSSWFCLSVLAKSSNLTEVAVFNASSQIFGIIYLAPMMLAQVLMSSVASGRASKDGLIISLKGTVIFVVPLSLITAFFSSDILALYGESYRNHTDVLHVTLLTVVIVSILNQLDHYANGLGLARLRLISFVVFSFFYVLLVTLSPIYGALSLAVGLLISYTLRLVVVAGMLRYYYEI